MLLELMFSYCLSSNDSAKVRQFSNTTKFHPAELC